MTAAIPVAVSEAKKKLSGNSASRKAPVPEKIPVRSSRISTAAAQVHPALGDRYGRGASPRRSGPGSTRAMQPHARVLVAEWVLGVVLIVATVPAEKGPKGYPEMVSTIMLRLSALTGIFFALSLIGTAERVARFAMWFGLIVDLGIIFHATTTGSTKSITNVFSGKPLMNGGVTLAGDFTSKDDPPQPTPFGSPGGSSGTSPANPGTSSGSGSGPASLSPNYPGGSSGTIPTPGVPT